MGDVPLNILVADDEPMVREALTEILMLADYIVHPACDGAEALEILRTRRVDLVVTDLMMPGMTGIELVEKAARIHPNLPFIVLTAFGTTERARESLQRGAVDFLTKPLSRGELIIAIERNLERRKLEAERLREAWAEVLFQAIQALANTIDLRDPYTAGHSQRVARIADVIARAGDVPDEERYALRLAGAMHDIGKIGVRDAVLSKPDALGPAEWEQIRQHPHHSSQVISHIQELAHVATIIRHHHENVDGTGYPDGLQGDAIPFLARVLAVADGFEAMTSDRSYRKAMTRQGAIQVLREEEGHRYDRDVVAVLIGIESAHGSNRNWDC